jgi:hypothetical protein
MKEGARTPWGTADHVKEVAPGIWQVSTPGHGGYKLDRANNARVHIAWRKEGGWYEEDCEWSRVAITFPEQFTESQCVHAVSTAKQYTPDEYTAVTGKPVELAESRVLRERAFVAAFADKYVARTAWGDWHEAVPKGFVGVYATLGGANTAPAFYAGKYFLVTEAEYAARSEFGFVVDETKHPGWAGERAKTKSSSPRAP